MDKAEAFPLVLRRFRAWIGNEPFRLCAWGNYDLQQLHNDCRRHGLRLPPTFDDNYINLKKEFAKVLGVKRCGMAKALEIVGLPLEGTHHRGCDDARNIARLAVLVLPSLEKSQLLDNLSGRTP